MWKQWQIFLFLGSKFTADGDCSHEIRWLPVGRKAMTSLDKWVKKQRHHFDNKGPYSQGYGLSSGHIWLWELEHKESWVLNNLCPLTVVLEKTFKSPMDSKVINSVGLKGNQPWKFIGRTDTEAEAPDLWPPDVNSWLNISLMLGKTEGRRKWGHDRGWCLDGITDAMDMNLDITLGDGGRQGDLACCSPWGHKEPDTTWQLNNKQRNHRT